MYSVKLERKDLGLLFSLVQEERNKSGKTDCLDDRRDCDRELRRDHVRGEGHE
ncbi:hypothetical protein MTR_7g080310 [Medicago truncatula]|uniref:Uncharacterized protein n=1 Tax=Medicago truncatula TaxID=3880 RepID=G7KRK8_MEDTR|nr:hypothetical protein MTR_7g080310 [Medicago truncatula]